MLVDGRLFADIRKVGCGAVQGFGRARWTRGPWVGPGYRGLRGIRRRVQASKPLGVVVGWGSKFVDWY